MFYLAIKLFAGESDSSISESETPDSAEFVNDVEDASNHSSGDESQGNDQGDTTAPLNRKARKQQFDEVCLSYN